MICDSFLIAFKKSLVHAEVQLIIPFHCVKTQFKVNHFDFIYSLNIEHHGFMKKNYLQL